MGERRVVLAVHCVSVFASPVEAPTFSPFRLIAAEAAAGRRSKPTILTPDALTRVASLVEHGRSAVEIGVSGEQHPFHYISLPENFVTTFATNFEYKEAPYGKAEWRRHVLT